MQFPHPKLKFTLRLQFDCLENNEKLQEYRVSFCSRFLETSSTRSQVAKMKVLNCLMPIGLAIKIEFW